MNSPSTLQAVILGLCLGAIYGLFFYQRYRSQFFWLISGATGIASGILMNVITRGLGIWDDQFMLAAMMQITLPSVAIIAVNRLLLKQGARKRRSTPTQVDDLISNHSFTSFL
ncbi:MAG TPA: hypothetical protein VFH43_08215 [Candidatus Kapabacteria bacterium]|nr:hypothetical protein [Candidatus Kapabacteria bacterium]